MFEQDGVLSKEEIREFIQKSLQRGRFTALFEAIDRELKDLVEQLMSDYFNGVEFDPQTDSIDILMYYDQIELLEGDPLQAPLHELFDPKQQEFVTKQQIKDGLTKICQNLPDQIKEKIEEMNRYREEVLEKTGGNYAR